MGGRIFISYRRQDEPGFTGRIFDALQQEFQPDELFLDVDNIEPGLDFVEVVEERIAACHILLAIIGPRWLDCKQPDGTRRLDDSLDYVRLELREALNRKKRVIPILVGDGEMPQPEQLPEEIRLLSRRRAMRITHESFRSDMESVIKALKKIGSDVRTPGPQGATGQEARNDRERELALRKIKYRFWRAIIILSSPFVAFLLLILLNQSR